MIFNGYREYGVDAIGLNPDGYFSDVERTDDDPGYRLRPARQHEPGLWQWRGHAARLVPGYAP